MLSHSIVSCWRGSKDNRLLLSLENGRILLHPYSIDPDDLSDLIAACCACERSILAQSKTSTTPTPNHDN